MISLLDAITDRYASAPVEADTGFFQMVGMEQLHAQQCDIGSLETISVVSMNIETVAEEDAKQIPSVTDLDLNGNCIADVARLFAFCSALPNLKSLCLARNPLREPSPTTTPLQINTVKLTVLNLSGTGLSWRSITDICSRVGLQMRELWAGELALSRLDHVHALPRGLRLLHLADNRISEWSEIAKLAELPHLEVLMVANNQLTRVEATEFPALVSLSLSDNAGIKEWDSIDALGYGFPCLKRLRLKRLNFQRAFVLGKLGGKLEMLDGGNLTAEEVADSCKYYWRHQNSIEIGPMGQARLAEIKEELGAFWGEGGIVETQDEAKKPGLCKLNFHLSDGTVVESSRALPATLPISALKQLIFKETGVEPFRQTLAVTLPGSPVNTYLDDDQRQLSDFGLLEGKYDVHVASD